MTTPPTLPQHFPLSSSTALCTQITWNVVKTLLKIQWGLRFCTSDKPWGGCGNKEGTSLSPGPTDTWGCPSPGSRGSLEHLHSRAWVSKNQQHCYKLDPHGFFLGVCGKGSGEMGYNMN